MARIERLLDEVDAALGRLEREQVKRLRTVLSSAYNRLRRDLAAGYPGALAESEGWIRELREARAQVLVRQLSGALQALRMGEDYGQVLPLIREAVMSGERLGAEGARELLRNFGARTGLVVTPIVPLDRVAAVVEGSAARLRRYSAEAVGRIEAALTNGLVRGAGVQEITREVKGILIGTQRQPQGGLYYQAERIVRTEIISASNEARRREYASAGVEYVQWYATLDERTCPYCAARHGNVYPRDEAIIPIHPACRCWAAPFRRDWLEEGLIDTGYWRKSQDEIGQLLQEAGKRRNFSVAPFEVANGRPAPAAVWTPRSGYL